MNMQKHKWAKLEKNSKDISEFCENIHERVLENLNKVEMKQVLND